MSLVILSVLNDVVSNRTALASILLVLVANTNARTEDWPQFRGPNCSGVSVSNKPLPVEFSEPEEGSAKNIAWSRPLADGIGSPVVADGRVFTSGMAGKQRVALYAFDAVSGEQLWERQWDTGPLQKIGDINSYASSTPVADAERVYFYFTKLGMLAVDARTGQDVWHTRLPNPFFTFGWGPGASPVLYRDKLLFCQDDDLYPALQAFDKRTGEILWRDDRLDMNVNYSAPVICTTDGVDEIVVAGTAMLIGHDPDTGERKWWAKVLLRNIKTTPVSHNGVVYISLASGGIANQWLATADIVETGNNDGKLTRKEIQDSLGEEKIPEAFFERTFGRGDLNNDGYLEGEEIDRAFMHPDNFAGATYDAVGDAISHRYLLAVRGGGRGDVTDTHVVWRHSPKKVASLPSPLVVNDRMYGIADGGIMFCQEILQGENLSVGRLNNVGNYFASPVYGDGKIYVAGESGFVLVLREGPELELLARNDMGNDVLGTPAISDGRIYIRARNKLVCVAKGA
jgi:outer membrane protein assembly factor BamB